MYIGGFFAHMAIWSLIMASCHNVLLLVFLFLLCLHILFYRDIFIYFWYDKNVRILGTGKSYILGKDLFSEDKRNAF